MADFDANFMQGPMDDVGTVKLSGSIERVIYANDENGYAICDLGTDTDELVTITGTLPYIGEGDTVTVWGKWVHNPKYGRQFKVEQAEKLDKKAKAEKTTAEKVARDKAERLAKKGE